MATYVVVGIESILVSIKGQDTITGFCFPGLMPGYFIILFSKLRSYFIMFILFKRAIRLLSIVFSYHFHISNLQTRYDTIFLRQQSMTCRL